MAGQSAPSVVRLWALVDRSLSRFGVIETFSSANSARRALDDVLHDEPEWIDHLAIVPLELPISLN